MVAALLFVAPMELLKLSMIAAFAFKAMGLPLPSLAATMAFLAALALGLVARLAGGRRLSTILAQVFGLGLALFAVYVTGQGSRWQGPAHRYFLSAAVMVGAFWIRGAWLAKSSTAHAFCLARFEEGIAVYLSVFFISFSTASDHSNALGSSLAFFACGILALGVSKARNSAAGGFEARRRGTPLALAAAGFLAAAASIFYIARSFQQPAERARMALKEGALEFIRRLGELLDRLYTIRHSDAVPQDSGETLYRMAEREAAAGSLFARILFTVFTVIMAAVVLAILIVLLVLIVRAVRALAAEKTAPADLSFVPAWLSAFVGGLIRACARLLLRFVEPPAGRRKKKTAAGAAYATLLSCGRAAAAPRRHTETAREYAGRLSRLAPRAAGQALFIAQSLEREVYGNAVTDAETAVRLVAARASLHPYWFAAERFRRPHTPARSRS